MDCIIAKIFAVLLYGRIGIFSPLTSSLIMGFVLATDLWVETCLLLEPESWIDRTEAELTHGGNIRRTRNKSLWTCMIWGWVFIVVQLKCIDSVGKCNFTSYKRRLGNGWWITLMITTQSHVSWTVEMNISLGGWRGRVSGSRKLLQRFGTQKDMISGLSGTGESSAVRWVLGRRDWQGQNAILVPQDWLFALIFIRPRSEVVLEMTSVSSGSQLGEGLLLSDLQASICKANVIIFTLQCCEYSVS